MDRLKCMIVDDELLGREALHGLIGEDPELNLVGAAGSGNEALTLIQTLAPHLLFLDIEMPDMSGFELLDVLRRERGPLPVTVFVTAFVQYAVKAFEAQAVDYLLKPFDSKRFRTAVEVAKHRARVDGQVSKEARMETLIASVPTVRYPVRADGKVTFMRLDTIDWVEAQGNYLCVHSGNKEHTVRETMNSFEQRLNALPFARIHRSYIVNLDRILNVQPWYTGEYIVRLSTGKELTMSRTYRDNLLSRLGAAAPKTSGRSQR